MAVKQILVGKAGSSATPLTLIKGDSNTQIIEMIVDRYYGGVDLEGLAWSVTAENAEGASDEYKGIKASVSEAGVIIQWKVTGTATAAVGITKFKLSGYAENGGRAVVWQSGDYFIRINDTFEHVPGAETQAALTEVQKLIVYVDGALSGVINAGKDAEAAAIAANKAADRANSVADGKNEGRITALEQFTTKPGEPYAVTGKLVQLDNFEGMPMNVVTHIEPVLSGSGDPYPGGGGTNLADATLVQGTRGTDGVLDTGTSYELVTTDKLIPVKPGMTLYVNTSNGSFTNSFRYFFYDSSEALLATSITSTYSSGIPVPSNAAYFAFHYGSDNYANYIGAHVMVADGEFATYAPYSNIRPISGHGGAKLTRCEKNLANTTLVQGARGTDGVLYTGTGFTTVATYELIHVKPGMTLYVNTSNGSFTNSFRYYFYDFSETLLTTATTGYNSGIPVPSNAAYFAFHYGSDNYANYIGAHVMVADGEFATYEPYQGDTFSASFGQTVYGGTLDWNTGVLTVDRGYIEVNGDNTSGVSEWAAHTFALNCSAVKYAPAYGYKADEYCDRYRAAKNYSDLASNNNTFTTTNSWQIIVHDNRAGNADELVAIIASEPFQVAYKLASPTTIQLTPQDIHALQGENNLWSSAGEVTVSGRKDVLWLTGHLIDKIRTLEEAIVSMGGNV